MQSGEEPEGRRIRHFVMPRVEPRQFGAGFHPGRAAAILVSSDKWANGTELRYHFLEQAPNPADADVVRAAFQQWQDLPIGLRFREVADRNESEVRIASQPVPELKGGSRRSQLHAAAPDGLVNRG
jgi:hypothetical protein